MKRIKPKKLWKMLWKDVFKYKGKVPRKKKKAQQKSFYLLCKNMSDGPNIWDGFPAMYPLINPSDGYEPGRLNMGRIGISTPKGLINPDGSPYLIKPAY